MRRLKTSRAAAAIALASTLSCGALAADAPRTAEGDTLVVVASPADAGLDIREPRPDDDLQRLLQRSAFATIRRGAPGSTDLYADGFKRGDIAVVIDGERFTTACPNRMDTRVGNVDLREIGSVVLDRSGDGLQSGLGGLVEFRRRLPGEKPSPGSRAPARSPHRSRRSSH